MDEQQYNQASIEPTELPQPEGTSPQSTEPMSPKTDFTPPAKPEKKSKKKLLIIITTIILLLGVAAGAWYFLIREDSAENSSNNNSNNNHTNEQQITSIPNYFVVTGPLVEFINDSSALETSTNLASNEVVTDVRNVNSELRVYYYTTQPDDFYGKVINGFGYAVGNEKKQVATFNESGPTYYSAPSLSPDASKLIMEGEYKGDAIMGDIYIYDTASGEGKVIYETNKTQDATRDLFVIVGWVDNSTVLVQEQTCRECDGPRKAVLHKLNVDSGTLTPFFNENDSIDTLGWATFFIEDGKIYVFGGDFGKVFGGAEDQDFAPDELYEVNSATGEAKLITTFDDEIVQVANIDNGKLYVTLRKLVPSDAADAPYQSIDGNMDYSQGELLAVDLSDGSKSPVNIETKYFTNRSYAESVHSTDNGLIILTNTSFTEVKDGITFSGGDYALFELPSNTETSELKLIKENRTIYDENAVYMTLFEAQ